MAALRPARPLAAFSMAPPFGLPVDLPETDQAEAAPPSNRAEIG